MTKSRTKRRRSYRLRDRALLVTGFGLVLGVLLQLSNSLAGPNAEPPAIEGGLVIQLLGGVATAWLLWGVIELMAWMDWRSIEQSRERYGRRTLRESKSPEETREGLRLIQGGRR